MNKQLTKEEYIGIIEFLDFFYGDNLIATAELRKEKPKEVQEEDLINFKSKLDKLKELINEHFKVEYMPNYQYFKLYSDSVLNSFTKAELIEYIHVVYNNWGNTDSFYAVAVRENNRLLKRKNKLEEQLVELKSSLSRVSTQENSNPPLKFEELEENNWYWDNKDKEWCKYISYSTFEYLDGYGSEFEENRFFLHEVKEVKV